MMENLSSLDQRVAAQCGLDLGFLYSSFGQMLPKDPAKLKRTKEQARARPRRPARV